MGKWKKKQRICFECGDYFSRSGNFTWCENCDTAYFIRRSRWAHGDKYNYSLSEYTRSFDKLKIICPFHGIFEQIPQSHIKGHGCIDCVEKRKHTNQTFIKKAVKAHGKKYDYGQVDYITSLRKVRIRCRIHGLFEQTPSGHFSGQGCPECANRKKLTGVTFIKKAREVHGEKYNYKEARYIDRNTKIRIGCGKHGFFLQVPKDHLAGHGCPTCSGNKKHSTATFIEKAVLVHGEKYDYKKVSYANRRAKVKIICPVHGVFAQTPASHLEGSGCIDCAGKRQYTTKTFIAKAIETHGNRYDYRHVEYVGNDRKVKIRCRIHGIFEQRPSNHFGGQGCPECHGRKKITGASFIERSKEIHGEKYDYKEVKYIDRSTRVRIGCGKHGFFLQVPKDHLAGHGCSKCSGNMKGSTATFIEKAIIVHGKKYDYKEVSYVNNTTSVKIICPEHGVFSQVPKSHIKGCECPECAILTRIRKLSEYRLKNKK